MAGVKIGPCITLAFVNTNFLSTNMGQRLKFEPAALTLGLQLADRIGARIIDEDFKPGARLKEVALAEAFQVSRVTIREALRILEKRGLVSIFPQRGAQVIRLSRKELEDLFEIRTLLLGLMSRRVALSCTAEVERRLFAGYRALQAANRDSATYAHASANLVAELTKSCGNDQLTQYIADFAQRIGRYTRLGLSTPARRTQSLRGWRRLLDAIVDRDGELAEAVHRQLSTQNFTAALAEFDRRAQDALVSSVRPKLVRAKGLRG